MHAALLGQTQTFNASGTFTVPHKVTSVKAELWGGGGGGSYFQTVTKRAGSGGGGGAYVRHESLGVTPSSSMNVTIGDGGTGGNSTVQNGGNGGNTSFDILTANGGTGAEGQTAGQGGTASSGTGIISYSGGNSTNAPASNDRGGSGGGSSAGTTSNGNNGAAAGGNAGGSGGIAVLGGGAGGNGGIGKVTPPETNGIPGSAPGGGGGGRGAIDGSALGTGGAGANGQAIITWSCSTALTSAAGTDNQSFACPGTPIANITYEIVGAYGAVFSGLPPGVTGVYANGDVVISGTPLSGGTFNYIITPSGSCTSNVVTGTITVGGTIAGSVSGSNPTITLGNSTGTITLSGHSGTILKWQKKLNNNSYTDISNASTTYSETPAATGIWKYRAVLQASGGCSESYSGEYLVNVGTSLRTQTFTTTTSFTVPHKTNSIKAELWGGGGYFVTDKKAAAGGGGGAYSQKNSSNVSPGVNYSVIVGSG